MYLGNAYAEGEKWVHHIENWHPHFAWLPVVCVDGQRRWLETVDRRIEGGKARFDFDGLIRVWEYRRR